MGGGGERCVGVAPHLLTGPQHIVRGFIPHGGVIAHRGGTYHRGQRVDVDFHRIGAVLGGGPVGGNDHGYRIAGETNPVVGQGEMGGHDQRTSRSPAHGGAALGEILRGQHGHYAIGGPGIAGLDRYQPPVGHRTAHKRSLQ